MTKEELLQKLRDEQHRRLDMNMPADKYLLGCVEIMFEVAAEVLEDISNEKVGHDPC